jgi:Domain of unknown function (DUF4158)/Tn3 transposase DDE domain
MAEIRKLESWPAEVGRDELVQYFTLTSEDVAWVNKSARGTSAKLGLAVQLCALPWLGFVPEDVPAAPPAAASRLAVQLGLPVGSLASYGSRAQTRTDHVKLSAKRLGWTTAEADERTGWKRLREFLVERALEHDVPSVLFRLATQWLASDEVRMVRPGVVALMREIATARGDADGELFRLVGPILAANPALSDELDGLLVVPEEMSVSRMVWLHRGSTTYSPSGIKGELDKVGFLRGMGVDSLDVSVIPEARRRQLAAVGRRLRAQAIQRRDPDKRYPLLLATVAECYVEVLDEVVQMFDQALSGMENRAKRKVQEKLAARAKNDVNKMDLLEEMLAVTTDLAVPDAEVGGLLRGGIGLDRMRRARRDPKDRFYRDHGHLDTVEDSFTYLRQFAPEVIKTLEFRGGDGAVELLRAVGILRELYVRGGRNVPAGAPTPFVPARWKGYLSAAEEDKNTIAYRHYWELCVLLALRDGLRSGDVWVPGSRRYADPTTILMPVEEWEQVRAEYCALVGMPATADEALAQAEEQLRAALVGLEPLLERGDGPVRVSEQGELVISKLTAEDVPDEVETVRMGLVELLPRLPITELLIEVDRWTGFSDKLTHAGGKSTRDDALLRQIYAAVLAQSCNFGITAMAESTGLTYDKLAWTTQ